MTDEVGGRSKLLAVDPGLVGTGFAFFVGGRLYECGVTSTFPPVPLPERIWQATAGLREYLRYGECEVVAEWPQIYRYSMADPNDLLPLAAIVGNVIEFVTALYLPRQWKGQVKKGADFNKAIEALLGDDEREGWRMSKNHNARDAVGLGLFHLGRYHPPRATRKPTKGKDK